MNKKGLIKKFFKDKGYGFIKSEEIEVFFHVSNVLDYKDGLLSEGMEVEFSLGVGRQGKGEAKKIKVLGQTIKDEQDNRFYLPSDTVNLINHRDIENYYLKLNKAAYYCGEKFVFYLSGNPKKGQKELDNYTCDFREIDFGRIINRQRAALEEAGLTVRHLVFKTDWRLVVGLGGVSVYETSMTLHHIYGIPYIPGSAIKGVVRSWIITNVFNNDESKALWDPGFCRIFGSPSKSALGDYKGAIRFFDAFPIKKPTIKRDIMNPHYISYYTKGEPPRDDENPIPVPFLTVKDAEFQFFIAAESKEKRNIEAGQFAGQEPIEVAAEWLYKALTRHGIGAKTALGYGYLSPISG